MTGFAVYSSDYDPQRLYSRGDVSDIDTMLVERVVRFGDGPLDLLVDFEDGQVVWSFKAERRTASARTGYFIAAYHDDGDLFRGFEAELRRLHDSDEWAVPYAGDLRWDLGFDLWRVPAKAPDLTPGQFETVADRVSGRGSSAPVEFGMTTRSGALRVVRALDAVAVDCTVAVGSSDTTGTVSDVDLFLRPGGQSEYEPRSDSAKTLIHDDPWLGPTETQAVHQSSPADDSRGSFGSRIAGVVVLVCLGFALYSFVSPTPVQPLTGLATVGGLTGSIAALALRDWLRESAVRSVRATLLSDTDRSLPVLAYGTLLGFGFPRVMWEVGTSVGRDGFLLGSVVTPVDGFVNVLFYVVLVFVVSVGLLALVRREGPGRPSGDTLVTAALGHAAYALFLFGATGFAGLLWFRLIPSA